MVVNVQRFRRDVGIAVAREFARYRLLRVPFVGVPRAVIRDRHAGRREARAVPAQGPMQADFFRHQADIWHVAGGGGLRGDEERRVGMSVWTSLVTLSSWFVVCFVCVCVTLSY